jgi:hypothetical protein
MKKIILFVIVACSAFTFQIANAETEPQQLVESKDCPIVTDSEGNLRQQCHLSAANPERHEKTDLKQLAMMKRDSACASKRVAAIIEGKDDPGCGKANESSSSSDKSTTK